MRQEDISLQRNDWGEDLDRDSTAASIKKASMDVFVPGLGISYQFLNGLQVFSGIHNGFSPPGPGINDCLLYTSPSPRDKRQSRMPSSA